MSNYTLRLYFNYYGFSVGLCRYWLMQHRRRKYHKLVRNLEEWSARDNADRKAKGLLPYDEPDEDALMATDFNPSPGGQNDHFFRRP